MWDDADIEEDVVAAPAEEAPAANAENEGGEAKTEEAVLQPEEPTVVEEAKKLVFKHWVRPKFLQYRYLYDYQHNYYDDVINYLDKRNRGLPVEKPKAQTWGERAHRTYLAQREPRLGSLNQDKRLLKAVSTGARFHRYHSKSLISRKYSTLGFNTVSI